MPQSGFTPIITYNTATASAAPVAGNLSQGELAVNVTDLKLYTKNSGGSVVQVGSGPSATETLTNKTISAASNTLSGVVTGVSGTAPVVSSGGATPAISMAAASSGVNGYMTGTYATKLDGIATGATANVGTVTGVTATAPVASSGGAAPVISMPAASSGVNGYMTGTYATKLDGIATGATANTGTVTGVTATSPVVSSGGTAPVISMGAASAGVNGYMTGAYATKLDGIATGATANTGTVTGVTGTAPVVSSGGAAPAISMAAATASVNGYMTNTYAAKLDGIAAGATANTGTVTGVTGTAPVVSSGGTAPAISMAAATASVNGYMTSTYASKLDGIAAGATAVGSGTNLQLNSLGVGTAGSGTAGEIRATNNVTAYYTSDQRLKENVEPITGALDMLSAIRGVHFDWKDEVITQRGGEDGYFVRKHDIGVIAQEIEAVVPEAVARNAEGFLAVRYELLVPVLINAINELHAEINLLRGGR